MHFYSYHSRNSEVSTLHLLSEPVNFPPCVDENDCLRDCQGLIQVTQCVQLPFLGTNTMINKVMSLILNRACSAHSLTLGGEEHFNTGREMFVL